MPFALFCERGGFPCLYLDKVKMFTALCYLLLGFGVYLFSYVAITLPNIVPQSSSVLRLRVTVGRQKPAFGSKRFQIMIPFIPFLPSRPYIILSGEDFMLKFHFGIYPPRFLSFSVKMEEHLTGIK